MARAASADDILMGYEDGGGSTEIIIIITTAQPNTTDGLCVVDGASAVSGISNRRQTTYRVDCVSLADCHAGYRVNIDIEDVSEKTFFDIIKTYYDICVFITSEYRAMSIDTNKLQYTDIAV